MLDSIAGFSIGAFLLGVVINGKTTDMISLAKRDKAFLQWAIAVAILLYLHGIPELSGPVKWIIILAFVGLFLNTSDKISENASKFWSQLGGA